MLPFLLYKEIIESPQVDHVSAEGDKIHIWTTDKGDWIVSIIPI